MAEDEFLDSTLEVTVTTDRESLFKKGLATGEAILIVISGTRLGHRAILDRDVFVIGRGASAGLQLEGDAISRVHARVTREGSDYLLVDAGSTNGSFVNYKKVSKLKLSDGDEIQIGHTLLKFLSGDNIETSYHEEIRRLARRDALTGAINRPTFDQELKSAVASHGAAGTPLSLVLFDLDHFKQVNDTWGHTVGDLVLRAVGERTLGLVQAPHLFARIGGEEFGVLFAGPLSEALALGERLHTAIGELRVVYEGEDIRITTSLGVAQAAPTGSAADLYQTADRLLYRAKESGRDRVCGDVDV